jgi:hypothetical protein
VLVHHHHHLIKKREVFRSAHRAWPKTERKKECVEKTNTEQGGESKTGTEKKKRENVRTTKKHWRKPYYLKPIQKKAKKKLLRALNKRKNGEQKEKQPKTRVV